MMLMSYVQWDGEYSLFSDISARQCLEQKHGNNAMLNFIYLSMLVRKGTYPREMHVLWNEFLNQAGKADREMIVLVRKESES